MILTCSLHLRAYFPHHGKLQNNCNETMVSIWPTVKSTCNLVFDIEHICYVKGFVKQTFYLIWIFAHVRSLFNSVIKKNTLNMSLWPKTTRCGILSFQQEQKQWWCTGNIFWFFLCEEEYIDVLEFGKLDHNFIHIEVEHRRTPWLSLHRLMSWKQIK